MQKVHVHVEGRVQGVFFRDFTRQEANRLRLTGWVKNMPDGTVEGVFCGEEKNVESMLKWLKIGSPHSRVSSISVKQLDTHTTYGDFKIAY